MIHALFICVHRDTVGLEIDQKLKCRVTTHPNDKSRHNYLFARRIEQWKKVSLYFMCNHNSHANNQKVLPTKNYEKTNY